MLHEEANLLAFAGNTNCQDIILSGGTGSTFVPLFGIYWANSMTLHWAKTIHHGVWMGGMTISSDSRLLLMHFIQSVAHLQVWRIWDALHLKTFYYQNSWDNYVDGNIMLLGTDTTVSPK